MLLGAIWGLSGISLPEMGWSVLQKSSGCMAPCSMLLMGIVVSQFSMKSLLKEKKSIRCNLFAFIANPDSDWRNSDVGLCEIYCANCCPSIRNALWIEYNRISKACKRRLPYRGGISCCVNGVGVCYHSACTGNIWDNLVKRSWITIYFAALKII